MAELTIKLITNSATGKKDIIVDLRSDDDMLPHEHEQLHRELVDKLIQGGALQAGEAGALVVERDSQASSAQPASTPQPEDDAESNHA